VTAPDRIPCLTPGCRRTAPADKWPLGTQIVCAKCWPSVPPRMRARYVQLRKRRRTLQRLVQKHETSAMVPERMQAALATLDHLQQRNWREIYEAVTGRDDMPTGLESFMDEMGLTERTP
jgi:hypothetical protein